MTQCSSPGEWVNKLWYIYLMEYYTEIKRNKHNNRDNSQKQIERSQKHTLWHDLYEILYKVKIWWHKAAQR